MRRILAAPVLLIVVAAFVWARPGGRSGETEPDWNHLRLDPETMDSWNDQLG